MAQLVSVPTTNEQVQVRIPGWEDLFDYILNSRIRLQLYTTGFFLGQENRYSTLDLFVHAYFYAHPRITFIAQN